MKEVRPIKRDDVVRINRKLLEAKTGSAFEFKTGVVVRVNENSVCVVITGSNFDHGVWFSRDEIKRIGRVHNRRK